MKNVRSFLNSIAAIFFLLLPGRLDAQSPVPNFDFELWTGTVQNEPAGWRDNNTYLPPPRQLRVQEIAGVVGNGVHIAGDSSSRPIPGGLTNSSGIILAGDGGAPYTGSGIPANFNGYYRYHMVTDDSAQMLLVFKKDGAIVSVDSFTITGTQPVFTAFNLPLTPMSVIPDTVIFSAASGAYDFYTPLPAGSYVDLDELHFTNDSSTYPMPHGDFDTWTTTTVETPDDWDARGNVTQTTDRHSGAFAAKLTTADNGIGEEPGRVYGSTVELTDVPYIDTLTGYYKYSTPASDKGVIEITFWDHVVTGGSFTRDILLTPAATYTRFAIPLNNSIHASDFNFFFSSSYTTLTDGSTLFVDDLQLKSGRPVGITEVKNEQCNLTLYPLPCKDIIHVLANSSINNCSYSLYNIFGQKIESGTVSNNCIYLQNVPGGTYICAITVGDQVLFRRITVVN